MFALAFCLPCAKGRRKRHEIASNLSGGERSGTLARRKGWHKEKVAFTTKGYW